MKNLVGIVLAVLLLGIVSAPGAAASSEIDVQFSSLQNPHVVHADQLVAPSGTPPAVLENPVALPALFAQVTPLSAGASFTNASFDFTIHTTASSGNLTVALGYADADGSFHVLANKSAPITNESRNVYNAIGPTGTPVDIGVASAHFEGLSLAYPKGSFVAVRVSSDSDSTVPVLGDGMYTQASLLGATDSSTATVPLPELPGIALFGLGLATVGGVVLYNRRR